MSTSVDLIAAARALMREHGLEPDYPPAVLHEVSLLQATSRVSDDVVDLRSLPWSSIDNRESRDLDQVEVAELLADGTIRLLIGIADVDSRVTIGSATDHHAAINTVSVYTGVIIFPMLPEKLSTDLTSLNEDADRLAIVTELHIAEDGTIIRSDVFRALVRNHAKLDYLTIGAWLAGAAAPMEIAHNPELEKQLRLQVEASHRLDRVRRQAGALDVDTVEARVVMADDRVVDIAVVAPNAARDIVENFMVSANVAMARFLVGHRMSAIRRVVREPRRWARIVEIAAQLGEELPGAPDSASLARFLERMKIRDATGFPDLSLTVIKLLGAGEYLLQTHAGDPAGAGHFGLAVAEYTHSTAPNRRYPDLVIQRLAKAALAGNPSPYSDAELAAIARQCTQQEDAARKVERTMRKMAAAVLMKDRVGEEFDAIVTGAAPKGTFVRLVQPAVEGRIVKDTTGLDVGAAVRVRLAAVDAARGHIDFETVTS